MMQDSPIPETSSAARFSRTRVSAPHEKPGPLLWWVDHRPSPLGVPRDIVSPGVVQVIIQEDRWKQAELERPARLELLDDLPGAEVLFVGVGADEVEVELIGKGLGKEVAAAGERFQVEELIFDETVNGFYVA